MWLPTGLRSFVNWCRGQPSTNGDEKVDGDESNSTNAYENNQNDRANPWTTACAAIRRLYSDFSCRFHASVTWAEQLWYQFTQWCRDNPWPAALIVFGVVVLFLTLATAPILGASGFTAAGPAAGTFAAEWQSVLGTGFVFSMLQSAAMGGYGVPILAWLIAASGVAAGAGILAIAFWDKIWGDSKDILETESAKKDKSE